MENNQKQMKVNLPGNLPVLYTDATYLTISQYGVVLDVAQKAGPTDEHNIVARIGMSKEHALVMIEKLRQLLSSDKLKSAPVTQTITKNKIVD